jgi:hypothetical protein
METHGNKMIRATQTRWENDVKIGRTASRTGRNGKKPFRRSKHSMTEVVEPEEEEEDIFISALPPELNLIPT